MNDQKKEGHQSKIHRNDKKRSPFQIYGNESVYNQPNKYRKNIDRYYGKLVVVFSVKPKTPRDGKKAKSQNIKRAVVGITV